MTLLTQPTTGETKHGGAGPAVELAGVEKSFTRGSATTRVLCSVDLTIEPGECLFLLGPSGISPNDQNGLTSGWVVVNRPDHHEHHSVIKRGDTNHRPLPKDVGGELGGKLGHEQLSFTVRAQKLIADFDHWGGAVPFEWSGAMGAGGAATAACSLVCWTSTLRCSDQT